jgi:methyl-accepting chemotaxis protein
MNWIARRIRNKLLVITGFGTTLVLAAALFGFWSVWQALQSFKGEVHAASEEVLAIQKANSAFRGQVQAYKNVLLRGSDPAALDKHWGEVRKLESEIQQEVQRQIAATPDAGLREALTGVLGAHRQASLGYRQGYEAYKQAGFEFKAGDAAVKGVDKPVLAQFDKAQSEANRYQEEVTDRQIGKGLWGIEYGLIMMAAAIVISLFWFMSRVRAQIEVPARNMQAAMARLAQGDFSNAIQCKSLDEMGEIARSAEHIRVDLGKVIKEVTNAAREVGRSAGEVSGSASTLVSGSEQQSEAAAATAAAVEELTVSIASVAETARSVQQVSSSSREHAQHGNEKVSELIGDISMAEEAMGEIADSVGQFVRNAALISNMTQQVRDIANQTNLLALNAAIEAARAGEQGRGFAVVADEVRKLAEKSAQAAGEIDAVTRSLGEQSAGVEGVIQSGQDALSASLECVEGVAEVLAEANNSADEASGGVVNISNAMAEQSSASVQIARNVEHIARMAEENSGVIRRTAESARSLDALSGRLQAIVGHLKA